jgi:hypothetical protein
MLVYLIYWKISWNQHLAMIYMYVWPCAYMCFFFLVILQLRKRKEIKESFVTARLEELGVRNVISRTDLRIGIGFPIRDAP